MSFTIGLTGTRKGITEFQGEMLEQMLTGFIDSVRQPINVIHGGAEGADRSFHRIICTGGGYGLAEGDSFDVEQVDIIPSTVPDTDGSSSYDSSTSPSVSNNNIRGYESKSRRRKKKKRAKKMAEWAKESQEEYNNDSWLYE